MALCGVWTKPTGTTALLTKIMLHIVLLIRNEIIGKITRT